MRKMVLSILVDNTSGVLSRVSGLFSRRGYNITSLTVGETENPKVSRMTVVVRGEEQILEQIYKQVEKLEDVVEIFCQDKRTAVFSCRPKLVFSCPHCLIRHNNGTCKICNNAGSGAG